jgi:hypothetical protein
MRKYGKYLPKLTHVSPRKKSTLFFIMVTTAYIILWKAMLFYPGLYPKSGLLMQVLAIIREIDSTGLDRDNGQVIDLSDFYRMMDVQISENNEAEEA